MSDELKTFRVFNRSEWLDIKADYFVVTAFDSACFYLAVECILNNDKKVCEISSGLWDRIIDLSAMGESSDDPCQEDGNDV